MKRDELDDILEACLRYLQNGESLESCLARYPEVAEDLRPLLHTAQLIQSVPHPRTSSAAKEAGLAKMLATIDSARQPEGWGRIRQLGEITMKITFRFALMLLVGVIVLTWSVSFWQQAGQPDEVPEILPPAVETPMATDTLLPPRVNTATASPLPTDKPTTMFTSTPVPQTTPTPTLTVPTPTVPLPTSQPATDDNLPLPPPVAQNDGTTITVGPARPTTIDAIEIIVAGTARCSAVPAYQSYKIDDNVIQIEGRMPQSMVCAAVETSWEFKLTVDPLPVGEYRIEFFVTDKTRELWGRTSITVAPMPTSGPTMTCDERLRAEGQYIILLDAALFVDGTTENGETISQVAERLTTKHEGMLVFVWESLPGFASRNLSPDAADALAKELEVYSVDPDICVQAGFSDE